MHSLPLLQFHCTVAVHLFLVIRLASIVSAAICPTFKPHQNVAANLAVDQKIVTNGHTILVMAPQTKMILPDANTSICSHLALSAISVSLRNGLDIMMVVL